MTSTAVIERWVELFNAGNVPAIIDLYADKASLHVVFTEPTEGKAAIKAVFEAYFGAGELHCIVEKLHDAGEWVILEWRDANGLPGVNIYEVQDGRIVRQRNYFDQLTFFRKLGIPLPTE